LSVKYLKIMKIKICNLLLTLFTLLCHTAQAQFSQPGELDTTFNFGRPHSFFSNPANPQPGEGANSAVLSFALQPDGKMLIGGAFVSYNGTPRNRIARLNADGSLDASFNPGTGANVTVQSLALQPDGKVLIGGGFSSYNGTPRNYIARLNADGSLDASFNPGTGASGTVTSLALQPDGKVLIGGRFTAYNGTPRNNIARLNADGSLDATFNPGAGADDDVETLALQPDGKVLIGGRFFTNYNGTPRNRIARINYDGSLDSTFNPGTGVSGRVYFLALQPDGKVLIGGRFIAYNGTPRNHIARLNADGSLDVSFNPGAGANDDVETLALQPDGKILIGGRVTNYNGTPRNRIARINYDGSLDSSFNPGTGASNSVYSFALQPDGKVLTGGDFTSFDGTPRNRIARLNADGSLDATFNPVPGANGTVQSLALQPDGKVLVGGAFTSYNGTPRKNIARLNADGSLDASFNPGIGADNRVISFSLQPDGKVLIGGSFTNYNGTPRPGIARLNADGSLDATFNLRATNNGSVESLALQPDGKVLIGGSYFIWGGTTSNRFERLNADGSLDASFNPGTGVNGIVRTLALQSDGKVLIGGDFSSYNGTPRNRIARLNADGSLDTTFNPGTGTGAASAVASIALQPDGKMLIGGAFRSYNGTSRNRIARLNADGSLDTTFNPGTGMPIPSSVTSLALQPDGKVLIGGRFTAYNGTPRNNIARLNADGSLDTTFNPGTGTARDVTSLTLQPDGKVLIGGDFTSYNGIYRSRIARVFSPVDCALVPKANWTGAVSSDWHTAGNWSTGYVPTGASHVIIGPAANKCVIGTANALAYSVQVRDGGRLELRNGFRLELMGTCTQLPPP
jgi:uncharacterized delta-60 repeat protein